MPHRLMVILGMFSSVDWKALFVFMGAAAAMPLEGMPFWVGVVVRLLTPMVGGILWMFIKPKVIKWRKQNLKK